MHLTRRTPIALTAAAVLLLLAGCAAPAATTTPPDAGTSEADSSTANDTDDNAEDAPMLVLPGTGSYAIGTEMPIGGYQLHGEPDAQPAGCTWAILDADGGTTFENEGVYAFITDIPEAVTFVTDGCPDWEQFE